MKKLLSMLLAFIVVISVFTVAPFSAGAVRSGDYMYEVVNGYAKLTDYYGAEKILVVPSVIDGYTVTTIGDAFYNESTLEEVIIPDTVTIIGDCAFGNSRNLKKVSIASSVTEIGDYAFYRCYALEEINIPDSVKSIGNYAFSFCYCLSEIVLPTSVESVGEDVFESSALESIYFLNPNCEIIFRNTTIPQNATIYGCVNSTASTYANKNGNTFVIICEADGYSHNIIIDKGYSATCEEDGLTDGSHCSFCEKIFINQESIPAIGHTKVVDKGYDATNEKNGLTDGSHCSVCNKVLIEQEVIPALLKLGDTDCDGTITIVDATLIQRHLAQLASIEDSRLECADTDKDCYITILDVTTIQLYLAQLIPEL